MPTYCERGSASPGLRCDKRFDPLRRLEPRRIAFIVDEKHSSFNPRKPGVVAVCGEQGQKFFIIYLSRHRNRTRANEAALEKSRVVFNQLEPRPFDRASRRRASMAAVCTTRVTHRVSSVASGKGRMERAILRSASWTTSRQNDSSRRVIDRAIA